GCRSGKSGHALHLAEQLAGQKIFIATCVPGDKEMKQRVLHHQKQRKPNWKTLEVPLLLSESIRENGRRGHVILVDCLTLWINNLIMENNDPENIDMHIQKLIQSLEKTECPVILVSNEVGTGIVPENRLARLFRDVAGFANQRIAASVDRVVWMVAGIPVEIK
ncbi:MAG: bifunctional adenosylcobinamide kinase/adenosylcobinamide-phosphate guanylyltransferase, partial [Deltaproteobacteria bacterium]|nr:bifunctional adenosylcobinamide kinase/adenosylcobinamide-phosphate guanylyltransferase [Deltaproteobacteria bacterium]